MEKTSRSLTRYFAVAILISGVIFEISCQQNPIVSPHSNEWEQTTPEEQGVDSKKLERAVKRFAKHPTANLHGLLLIRNGKIITDYYAPPHNETTLHSQFSITKSFTSTLIGIAVAQGKLNIDQKVLSFFPDQKFDNTDDWKEEMTVRDILTMKSGIHWIEDYSNTGRDNPLYIFLDSPDWTKSLLDRRMISKPGSQFYYNTGNSHLLMAILSKSIDQPVREFAKEYLFTPLGIDQYKWIESPQGIPSGGFGLFLTPRDMARFGQLYLNNGEWEGNRILSKSWIKEATSNQLGGKDFGYGFQFWTNPEGYSAIGAGGQFISILPKEDLIIVATESFDFTSSPANSEGWTTFNRDLKKAIISNSAIPENPEAYRNLSETIDSLSLETPVEITPPQSIKNLVGQTILLEKNKLNILSIAIPELNENEIIVEIKILDPRNGTEKQERYKVGLDYRYTDNGPKEYPVLANCFNPLLVNMSNPGKLSVFIRGSFPDKQTLTLNCMMKGSILRSKITIDASDNEPVVWWKDPLLGEIKIKGEIEIKADI